MYDNQTAKEIINHMKYIKSKDIKLYNILINKLKNEGDITLLILKNDTKQLEERLNLKIKNIERNNKNQVKFMKDIRSKMDMEKNIYLNKFYEYLHSGILAKNNIESEIINENNCNDYKITVSSDIKTKNENIEIQAQLNIKDVIKVKKYKLDKLSKSNTSLIVFNKTNYYSYYKLKNTKTMNLSNLEVRQDLSFGGKEYYLIPLSYFDYVEYL